MEPVLMGNEIPTIDADTRTIEVPSEFLLGVETDNDAERVKFQCPKIVGDNLDLSQYHIYIHYQNAKGEKGKYLCEDIEDGGENITFSWLLSQKVTLYKGQTKFLVCAKKTQEETIVWNTTLANGNVLEGLDVDEDIVQQNDDVIEQILLKLEQIEASGGNIPTEIPSSILGGLINLNMATTTSDKYEAKGQLGITSLDLKLDGYVNKYVSENGLFIDGIPKTKEEIKDYLFNRDNCLYNGKLHKNGIYLVNSDEVPVEIRGIGTHILNAYTNMHTTEAIKTLKYYGINCIRISTYLEDRYDSDPASGSSGTLWKGYLNDSTTIKAEIEKIVDICVDLGLYCILDWHVMSNGGGGGTGDLHITEATEFFTYYAQKYANIPNVWYEFANEPFQTTYTDLADFVSSMRTIVKTYVNDPVMFVGVGKGGGVTETYQALSALGIDDVFVSLHSYGTSYQAGFTVYRNQGIPVCTTEWGIGAESGEMTDNMVTLAKGNLEYLHTEGILSCIWKFTDQEKSSNWGVLKLRDNTSNNEYYSYGGYIDELDLSDKGKILLEAFRDYAFSSWIKRESIAKDRSAITYNLTGVASSNNATSIQNGNSYTTTLSLTEGYNKIQTVSVTMGGSDITSTAYNSKSKTISISNVTGPIVINATAIYDTNIAKHPFETGNATFTDGTVLTVSNGNHIKIERGTSYNGFLNIGEVSKNSNNPTNNSSAVNSQPSFDEIKTNDTLKIVVKNINYSTSSSSTAYYWSVGIRQANALVSISNGTTGNQASNGNYESGVTIENTIDNDYDCGSIFFYTNDNGITSFEADVEIFVNDVRWV